MIDFDTYLTIMESSVEQQAEEQPKEFDEKEYKELCKKYMNKAKAHVQRALISLQQEAPPLIYAVLKSMTFIPTDDTRVMTMGVDDCGNLYYSPVFVIDEIIGNYGGEATEVIAGVLMHEAMHILDRTQPRVNAHLYAKGFDIEQYKSGRMSSMDSALVSIGNKIGNFAYDLVINKDVIDSGHKLIKDGIIAKKDNNDRYIYEIDMTTSEDTQTDMWKKDVTRISGEGAYDMFIDAFDYMIDKKIKQSKTQKQKDTYLNLKQKVFDRIR